MRRYSYTPLFKFGSSLATSETIYNIRAAVQGNVIPYQETTTLGLTRLDHLAGYHYGDPTLWWVIAAASNIGWGLQVPPGTLVRIPDQTSISSLLA